MRSKTCDQCGAQFAARNRTKRFCSEACLYRWHDSRRVLDIPKRHCDQCGEVFAPRRRDARFCGSKCSSRWHYEARGKDTQPTIKARGVKSCDIDLGLAVSGALLPPGQSRSFAEIAAYCGCTKQTICQIFAYAVAKFRSKIVALGIRPGNRV